MCHADEPEAIIVNDEYRIAFEIDLVDIGVMPSKDSKEPNRSRRSSAGSASKCAISARRPVSFRRGIAMLIVMAKVGCRRNVPAASVVALCRDELTAGGLTLRVLAQRALLQCSIAPPYS